MKSDGPHIRLILWKAHKAVEGVDKQSIAATGLGFSDFAVLEALRHKGPLPVNTIGRKVLLTSGSISTAVQRLERRNLVRRVQDPGDGRIFVVHLTPAGRKLIDAVFARHRDNLDALAAGLSPEERGELVRLLKKLGRHAESMSGGRILPRESC